MHRPNFCVECGDRLARKAWPAMLKGSFCDDCARRLNRFGIARRLAIAVVVAFSAFALGRYLRPAPPPLVIQRAANSPLSDLPVNLSNTSRATNRKESFPANQSIDSPDANDEIYICGARTKKGTPCRRRVHFAGERCYQHKGMTAIVPLEKLIIKH